MEALAHVIVGYFVAFQCYANGLADEDGFAEFDRRTGPPVLEALFAPAETVAAEILGIAYFRATRERLQGVWVSTLDDQDVRRATIRGSIITFESNGEWADANGRHRLRRPFHAVIGAEEIIFYRGDGIVAGRDEAGGVAVRAGDGEWLTIARDGREVTLQRQSTEHAAAR